MFLGTPRRWWIAAALLFIVALALISTHVGGTLGIVVGVLLLFASIAVFGMSPMRYGRSRGPATASPSTPSEPDRVTVAEPPGPRPVIEAGDPSDV